MSDLVWQTERLTLRRLEPDDASFILELINDPDWIRFIGDRGVRTVDQAREYISGGHWQAQREMGFGLNVVEVEGVPIGLCGLLKRDVLEDLDIGFAFLPAYRGKGYALEAARGMVEYGIRTFQTKRLSGIATAENVASIRILEALGMTYRGTIRLPNDEDDLSLYVVDL